MSGDPVRNRGRTGAALTWMAAGTLVLAVHAAAIVALVRQPETDQATTGGEPAIAVDLEPVEGETAPDEMATETPGDPATASVAAADAAAATDSVSTPPPPPEPSKVEPAPPPPPEPPKVEPVPPEPKRQASHASAASAAAEAAEDAAPAVQRLSAGREAAWRGKLVAHLNRFRRFPRGLGSGTARVGFTIDTTGRVTATDIVAGSGDAGLDAAARDLVQQASPFPPPPPGLSGRGLTFVVPIHFDGRRP